MLSDKEIINIFRYKQKENIHLRSINAYPSQWKQLDEIKKDKNMTWVQVLEKAITVLKEEK